MELVVGAEHDLDLLDRAPVAREHVVDARADEPAAELRERPAEVRAVADVGAPLLEHDLVRAELLEAGHREAGVGAEPDLRRRGEQRLARRRRRRSFATSSSTSVASAPSSSSTMVRACDERARGAQRPAQRRSGARADARGHVDARRPGSTRRGYSCGELLVGGEQRRALDEAARERRVAARRARRASPAVTPAAARRPRSIATVDDAVLVERDEPGEPVGRRPPASAADAVDAPRTAVTSVEHRGAQVDVRRVQAVALDRQRLERGERAAVARGQPRGLAGGVRRLDERPVDEPVR